MPVIYTYTTVTQFDKYKKKVLNMQGKLQNYADGFLVCSDVDWKNFIKINALFSLR